MPVNVMMGCPDIWSNRHELEYVHRLRDRLENVYYAAREHLQSSACRHKRFYYVRANKNLNQPRDMEWTMNKSRRKGKYPKMKMRWIKPLVVLNDVTYQLKMNEKEMKIIPYDLLKPCEARDVL